jgi:hypothetical protein
VRNNNSSRFVSIILSWILSVVTWDSIFIIPTVH